MTKKKRKISPWEKPNPQKSSTTLTPQAKAKAKKRAKQAGRKYPNLIDNMQAALEQKKSKSS